MPPADSAHTRLAGESIEGDEAGTQSDDNAPELYDDRDGYSDRPPRPEVELPANWECKYDQKNGRWFFLDHNNKTTTWEPPVLDAPPAEARPLPEGKGDPPDAICCPITQEIMVDPVLLVGDGHTYERAAISTWLREHDTSPLTNDVLPDLMLVPNHAVKKMTAEWYES